MVLLRTELILHLLDCLSRFSPLPSSSSWPWTMLGATQELQSLGMQHTFNVKQDFRCSCSFGCWQRYACSCDAATVLPSSAKAILALCSRSRVSSLAWKECKFDLCLRLELHSDTTASSLIVLAVIFLHIGHPGFGLSHVVPVGGQGKRPSDMEDCLAAETGDEGVRKS